METKTMHGDVLVGGGVHWGRVVVDSGRHSGNTIFVAGRLDLKDYKLIRRCKAVVCEDGGVADHSSVACRILGIPILLIADATTLLREGETITVDAVRGLVYRGRHDLRLLGRAMWSAVSAM